MTYLKQNFHLIISLFLKLLFILLFIPFYKPIVLAALFAFALVPFVNNIKLKMRLKNDSWAVIISLSFISAIFFIPISILSIFGLYELNQIRSLGNENLQILDYLHSIGNKLNNLVQSLSGQFGFQINQYFEINEVIGKFSTLAFDLLAQIIKDLPQYFLNYLIFIFSLFFLLQNKLQISSFFKKQEFLSLTQWSQLNEVFIKACYNVLISALVVSATQALIISTASLLTEQNQFLIIFVITFFFAFIPVIGSVPVSGSMIIYFLINENYSSATIIFMAALFAGISDNFIRAFMMKNEFEVHPFISLLSLIGAISIFGFSGLFLGPLISNLAFKINDIFSHSKEKDSTMSSENNGAATITFPSN